MTSGTRTSGRPGISAEEFGYLSGGPGRAAEVAVVRLLEGGLLRISREGVVSAVASGAAGAGTPLEAYVLGAARTGRMLGDLVKSTATSEAASSLRLHLVERGLVVSDSRRKAMSRIQVLGLVVALAGFASVGLFHLHIGIAIGLLVLALLIRWFARRLRRPVRRAGRREARRVAVAPGDRVGMVAQMGLLGRIGQFPRQYHVWEMLGIAPSAGATLRKGKRPRTNDGGTMYASSCSSCSSCSGGGCGADNSGCGSSGGSCGSSSGDSGSSCSSGSSCGSSCGGGGGD
ncbi:TIGR04222 domain-containing membrane protein [Umezawaea sp. Da 62-37]|uniref:TIGR04222 domain-containing membrane protein n=1 Tax=Umezawaea sp. Da 62-37 TaxID=3075927 RepID=UPI0028F71D22|nr:TIGR04222 domain-containing membrane protein [Umezawaea sp. Da 62-37]WNV83780.1 TIGR04222 domain-containing membrane protein [Umezawaea sp. Da 62-37]